MSQLSLTPIFISLFTIFYLFLSIRIGYFRGSPVLKLVFKMEEQTSDIKLQRNVRAHGNFSEYVPLFSILLLVAELLGQTSFGYLALICIVFSYGRVAHAICFAFYDYNPFLRISGMICTYLPLAAISIDLLFNVYVSFRA